ncbi:MAG: CoA-binding protein [Bacteroidota bacterium]
MSNMKTLVLGASLKPQRYSNMAIKALLKNEKEVVAVGRRAGNVEGVSIETTNTNFEDIHTITLYLNAQNQKDFYDYIISLQPKRVIFNPGTENPALVSLLDQNNIEVVQACTLVLLSTNQY